MTYTDHTHGTDDRCQRAIIIDTERAALVWVCLPNYLTEYSRTTPHIHNCTSCKWEHIGCWQWSSVLQTVAGKSIANKRNSKLVHGMKRQRWTIISPPLCSLCCKLVHFLLAYRGKPTTQRRVTDDMNQFATFIRPNLQPFV